MRKTKVFIRVSEGIALVGGGILGYQAWRKYYQEYKPQVLAEEPKPLLWTPPSRQQLLNKLKGLTSDGSKPLTEEETEFDLLIIGGGATGAGCVLDAATRGLKVACVEKNDFSSGTSSKSTKLVHGGIRYLEKAFWKLDYEQYNLVVEALAERRHFLHVAPYLSHQLPILLPVYKWYLLPYYYAGAKCYDLLAGNKGLSSSYMLFKNKALAQFPMLKADELAGAVVYYDGMQNDSRMNVALCLTAIQQGATVLNHVEVMELLKNENGKLKGATVRDTITGETFQVKAKGIVNATGPYSDRIRKMDDPQCTDSVVPSSGVHIVLPGYFTPKNMGMVDAQSSDGRVIFFLPWQGQSIAGTTDVKAEIVDEPIPTEKEVNFILKELQGYVNDDIKITSNDVLAAWSGLRPLVKDPAASNTQEVVRNHLVNVSPSGLLTIAGGKWTTYRAMAAETIDRAITEFSLLPLRPSMTEKTLLIGSHCYSPTMHIKLIQQFGLEEQVADHLTKNYGDRAYTVASLTSATSSSWPLFGKRLVNHLPFLEAEVVYAARYEYAQTIEDVISRRMRLSFLDCNAALESLPRVAEILASELGWSDERRQQELINAKRFLKSMGLELLQGMPSRSQFTKEELLRFKSEFKSYDQDNDGVISIEDFRLIVQSIKLDTSHSEVLSLFHELDKDLDGKLEFHDFLHLLSQVREIHSKPKLAQLLAQHQQ